METSFREANSLIRKWKEEKRIIQCSMMDKMGSACSVVGQIQKVDEESVRIDARSLFPSPKRGDLVGLLIYFHGARFSFQDWREAPEEHAKALRESFDSSLFISAPNGVHFSLFAAKLAIEIE